MASPSPIFFQITQLGPSTQIHKRKVHAFEVKLKLKTWGQLVTVGPESLPVKVLIDPKRQNSPPPFNYPSTICTQTDRDPDKGIKLVFFNFDVVHLLVIPFHGHFANPFWNCFFSFVLRICVKLLVSLSKSCLK